mmetsp:Transcript_7724/g.22785  ORF Transcript_7724/g.22785 Transcript_7724/m.22785 type:complete len:351 (+) Transcript_7724:436-1488(+)
MARREVRRIVRVRQASCRAALGEPLERGLLAACYLSLVPPGKHIKVVTRPIPHDAEQEGEEEGEVGSAGVHEAETRGEHGEDGVGGLRTHEDGLGLGALRVKVLALSHELHAATDAQEGPGKDAMGAAGEHAHGGHEACVTTQLARVQHVDDKHVCELPRAVEQQGAPEPHAHGHLRRVPARRLVRAGPRGVPVRGVHDREREKVYEDGGDLVHRVEDEGVAPHDHGQRDGPRGEGEEGEVQAAVAGEPDEVHEESGLDQVAKVEEEEMIARRLVEPEAQREQGDDGHHVQLPHAPRLVAEGVLENGAASHTQGEAQLVSEPHWHFGACTHDGACRGVEDSARDGTQRPT